MTPEEFTYVIGDWTGAHLAAQATFKDSVEVKISNGVSFMGRRVYPLEMRELADWLNRWADRYDEGGNDA